MTKTYVGLRRGSSQLRTRSGDIVAANWSRNVGKEVLDSSARWRGAPWQPGSRLWIWICSLLECYWEAGHKDLAPGMSTGPEPASICNGAERR